MSVFCVSDYQPYDFLKLQKDFVLTNYNSVLPYAKYQVRYLNQKLVILIDLASSVYSYHIGLKDYIFNQITPVLKALLKYLCCQEVNLELSIICTRLSYTPIHSILHSFKISGKEDYKDLIRHTTSILASLHKDPNICKDRDRPIQFESILKWSLFTLQMMNKSSLPSVILITSTVDSFISSNVYDGLIMQFCASEVSLSVISLCSHKGLKFGLNSDYLCLKDAAKASGGHFIKFKELEKKLGKLLFRTFYKTQEFCDKKLVDDYAVAVKLEYLLLDRFREGFRLWKVDDGVSLGLYCGDGVYVEYLVRMKGNLCYVKKFLIGNDFILSKISAEFLRNIVSVNENFYERISWILSCIGESENFEYYLNQVYQGESTSKLLAMNVNIWHRWMSIKRFDVIIAKSNNEFVLTQGRKKLSEGIFQIFGNYDGESFAQVREESIIIGKVIWEGVNKAALYLGFHGDFRDEKMQEVYLELNKIAGIEVYDKAFGKIICENISSHLKYNAGLVQSVQTYKPHFEVLKAFLIRKRSVYNLLNSVWYPKLHSLLQESALKKGFFFIGDCNKGKSLFIKPQKSKDSDQCLFFQYLLHIRKSEVISEFFIDPDLINSEDHWLEIQNSLEASEQIAFNSLYALDHIIYSSVRKKLKDEDFSPEPENSNTQCAQIKLSTSDDIYCYIDNASTLTYSQHKKQIRKRMLRIIEKNQTVQKNDIKISILLRHCTRYTVSVNNFCFDCKLNKKWSVRMKFYENLITEFSEICDFSMNEKKTLIFARVLSEESVVLWILPKFHKFFGVETDEYFLEFFECSLEKIDIGNSGPYTSQSFELSEILKKSIQLVQKVYKSVFNYTFCQIYKDIKLSKKSLMKVIKTCSMEKKIISCETLAGIISTQWTDAQSFVSAICGKSIFMLSDSFRRIDDEFCEELKKYFKKVGKTNLYIYKDLTVGVFLKFGKFSSRLSHCFCDAKVIFKLYSFQKKHFFWRELQGVKKSFAIRSFDALDFVCQKATALMAQLTLELLLDSSVVDEGVIEKVYEQMKMIPGTVELSFKLNLITQNIDYTELIRIELQKNEVFYCRNVADFYYLVSNHTDKNFMTQKDFENEFCDWNYTDTNEYWIDFWTFISIEKMNTIKIIFYLPKHLEFEKLNTRIVEDRLKTQIKKLEIRVNQRILLKGLIETGKINSMLLPAESNQEQESEATKKAGSSRWASKKQINLKPAPSSQSLFRLPLHLSHYFPITDRLSKDDALGCLFSKYSIPPFSIDNIEDTFTLVHKQDICLFKFMETIFQVTKNFPHLSKSSGKDTGTVKVRFIKLLVYGIDAPDIDTFNKLKQNIEELLQQVSMTRLADSLTKNQRKILTANDFQFIIGDSISEIFMYKIPFIVNNFDLFSAMIKQTLLSFLSQYTIEESAILVYNFLNIIDMNSNKNIRNILSKHTGSANYLGNIFGKALALISFDLIYFDGENITEYKGSLPECTIDPSELNEELQKLYKNFFSPIPSSPGIYLELKISQKGSLNKEVFLKHMISCIRQNIFEYIFEKIQTKSNSLPFVDQFISFIECTKPALLASVKDQLIVIPHYSSWQNIFLHYTQILGIVEEQLDNSLKFWYGFMSENINCYSKNLSEIQEQWRKIAGEECVGNKIAFVGIVDQDSLENEKGQELKFYSSETVNGIYVHRSIFIYIQVTEKHLQICTYNLHRTLTNKIQTAVELHVLWCKERYTLLNSNLIQRLGLFYHNLNESQENLNAKSDKLHHLLPKSTYLLEQKGEKIIFPIESLLNPMEIVHSEKNLNEKSQDIILKHSYPLLWYGISKNSDSEYVKRHGMNNSSFLESKKEHIHEYEYCAAASVRWTVMKNTVLDRMIIQIAKKVKLRDEVHLIKGIIKSSHLFFAVSSKFYIKPHNRHEGSNIVLCEILKKYTEKLIKNTKFKNSIQVDIKSSRKLSYETDESPLIYVKNYYNSSGALAGEQRFAITNTYLKKVFDKSLILIEISYENSLIVTKGYCIDNFYKCFPMFRFEDLEYNSIAVKEMNKVKLKIDPVYELYDIQVRSISNLLNNEKLLEDFDVIRSLIEIIKDFSRPPRKCCNLVNRFEIVYKLDESCLWSPEEFFMFFFMNCSEKKFCYSGIGKRFPFAYKRIHETMHSSSIKWSLFTIDKNQTQRKNELTVKCYIIKCDENREIKNDVLKLTKKSIEKEFIHIMNEYKELYRNDQLWSKINEQNNNFSFEDFELLLKASKVSLMNEIDERIKYLTSFKNVFTFNCISYLTEVFYKNFKVFDVGNKAVLLIIYSQKILAQLILNKEEQSLEIFSVMRPVGCSQKEEDDLITNLINNIIQWLWTRFTMTKDSIKL